MKTKELKIILSDIVKLKQQGKTKNINNIISELTEEETKELLKLILKQV